MDPDEDELRQLCIEIVEEADAAAVTLGIVRQELRVEHDIVYEDNTVFELMHEMEDDEELVYHLGEYNDFAVPERIISAASIYKRKIFSLSCTFEPLCQILIWSVAGLKQLLRKEAQLAK